MIVFLCIGCFAIPLAAVALVAALLLLAWTIFVIIIYGVFANSASTIISKTLAPVSNTPPIATSDAPSAPSM